MATKRKCSWTAEENEQLKAFVARDVSIIRVAATLKRSILSVRNQARALGNPFPHMHQFRKKIGASSVNEWWRI